MDPMECEQRWASAYESYRREQMRADVFVQKVDEYRAELAAGTGTPVEVSELDYRMRLSMIEALQVVDGARAIEETLELWQQHRTNPAAFPAHALALPATNPPSDHEGSVLPNRFDQLIPNLASDAVTVASIGETRIEELIETGQDYRRERGDSQREIDNVRVFAYQGLDRFAEVLELIGERPLPDVGAVSTYEEAIDWFREYDVLVLAYLSTGQLERAHEVLTEAESAPIDVTAQPLSMIAASLRPLLAHVDPDTTLRRTRRVLTHAVGVPALQKSLLRAACVTAAGGLVGPTLNLINESEGHMRNPLTLVEELAQVFSIAEAAGFGAQRMPRFDAPRWQEIAEIGQATVAELAQGFREALAQQHVAFAKREGSGQRLPQMLTDDGYDGPAWRPEHFLGTGLEAAAEVDALGLHRLRSSEAPSPWTVMDYLQMTGEEDAAHKLAHQLSKPEGEALERYVAAVPRFLDDDLDTGRMGTLELVTLHDELVDGHLTDAVAGRVEEVIGMVRAQLARRPEAYGDRHAVEVAALGLPTLLALDPTYCINRASASLLKIAESFALSANGMRRADELRRGIASFAASVAENELSNPDLRSELIIIAEALEAEDCHIEALAMISLAQTYLPDPVMTGESVVGDASHDEMQLHLLTMKARNYRHANNTREAVNTYLTIMRLAEKAEDLDLTVDARAQALGALLDNRDFTQAANLWEDNARWIGERGEEYVTSHPGPRSTMAAGMLRTTIFMTDDAMAEYFPQALATYQRDARDYMHHEGVQDEDRTRHIIGETRQIVGELVQMEHLRQAAELATWASAVCPIEISREGHFLALTMQVPIHTARGDHRTGALLIETMAQQAREREMSGWYQQAVALLRRHVEAVPDPAYYRQALQDLGEQV